MVEVKIINQLTDNYSYIIYSTITNQALIIDPAESQSLVEFIINNNLLLEGILITHHHSDHTSGIEEIIDYKNVNVYSPSSSIFRTNKLIKNNDKVDFNFVSFLIIETPGHTLDHVVFYSEKENLLFSGDTLFCYGCGRVFEGTMDQMLNSLNRLINLPDKTKIYCGHEYTYKNLEFIFEELIEYKNKDVEKKKYQDIINKNGSSMPFCLDHQKRWNPFLNCKNINYKAQIANFYKNKGKISLESNELDFFTFIRNKRNFF